MEYTKAVGKRKEATALVKLTNGKGEIKVNNKQVKDYFCREDLVKTILSPLQQVKDKQFDIVAYVRGGGVRGQADALRLAISRAIIKSYPELRKILKPYGFLTCDAREKERRKYGLAKARKAFQWTKR
jgi:small subunit ribosomal protein S9